MKTIGKALLGASVVFSGLPATAHASDDIVRGVIGLGTAIILNEMSRQSRPQQQTRQQRQQQTRARQPSAQDIQAREDRREVQRRLNMLGFDTGEPDGVYGPRTRSAISSFQASIGQQPTGRITEEQIAALYSHTGGAGMASARQGFPALGTGQNGQSGGFPALNGGGQPAANAFPPLGGGAGQTNGQATAAFPSLGGAQNGQGGPAFPVIGGGGQPQQAGAAAFPGLASSAAAGTAAQQMPALAVPNATGSSAFPTLGAPSESSGQAQGAMPALSAAADQHGTEMALPSLSAPAQDETDAQPAMGFAPTVEAAPVTRTLAAELSKTIYAQATPPSVIGIGLGQDFDTARTALGEGGFDGCSQNSDETSIECFRHSASMNDQLRLSASPEQGVWAIARTISFNTPVPAGSLNERFSSTYPELMAQSSEVKAISSEPVCSGSTTSQSHLSDAIHRIEGALSRPHETAPKDAMEFSYRCPVVYSLSFSGQGGTVSQVHLVFINATVMDDIAGRRKTQEQEQVDAVSNDLRL